MSATSFISSSSIDSRPAVSRIRTSKPSRRAVSSARRVMASGISSGTIGRVGTPVCSPRILSCCCAAGRRVSSEAIMTRRLTREAAAELGRHALRALAQAIADLGRRGGLARALQAHHQDDDRRDGVEVEVGDGAAQHLDQVIVDDLDDHLARRDRADDVGADRLGPHPVDELADDRQGHVGFEQGGADLAQGRIDIGLGERTAPAKLVEDVTQTFAQTLEHPARLTLRSPKHVSRRCANLRGSAELPDGGTIKSARPIERAGYKACRTRSQKA